MVRSRMRSSCAMKSVDPICADFPAGHFRISGHVLRRTSRLPDLDVKPIGVALNTSNVDRDEARRVCEQVEAELGLPCQDPVAMGVDKITDRLLECFETCEYV